MFYRNVGVLIVTNRLLYLFTYMCQQGGGGVQGHAGGCQGAACREAVLSFYHVHSRVNIRIVKFDECL